MSPERKIPFNIVYNDNLLYTYETANGNRFLKTNGEGLS
jgi:hypothetical protein